MKRGRGLTLVELVVVMVLLLFIGLSVGGLVRVVRDTEQSINRTTEMNQTGRVILQRIASELSSALPLPVAAEGELLTSPSTTELSDWEATAIEAPSPSSVLTFYHEDAFDTRLGLDLDTLRFTASNADPRRSNLPQGDTIEIAYYIDTDPQTPEQGLIRSVGTLPGLLPEDVTAAQSEVLSDRVVSLNFRFYDPDSGEWLDTWDYTDVLPALVEISIGIAPLPCDEFLARSERDQTAFTLIEQLTTIVSLRVRSYPDPSVQQQQSGQPSLSPGMQQSPSIQRPSPTIQPQTFSQFPSTQVPSQFQRPSEFRTGASAQQRFTFGTRIRQGGGKP